MTQFAVCRGDRPLLRAVRLDHPHRPTGTAHPRSSSTYRVWRCSSWAHRG